MSRFHRTIMLAISLVGAVLVPLTLGSPAQADPGSGQLWRCSLVGGEPAGTNMNAEQREVYDCVHGTIQVYSNYSGDMLYEFYGTESHFARKDGRSHEWIRGNCKIGSRTSACAAYGNP